MKDYALDTILLAVPFDKFHVIIYYVLIWHFPQNVFLLFLFCIHQYLLLIPNTDNPISLNNQMHRVWFINTESVLLSQWIWCYIHHIYYNTWSLQAKQQIPKKWLVTYINISRAIKRTFIFITFFRTIIHSFYIFPPFFQMHHVQWRFAYLLFP